MTGGHTGGAAQGLTPHQAGRRAWLPPPRAALGLALLHFQGPHPAKPLPSPLSWEFQSASLFPEPDYMGEKTHTHRNLQNTAGRRTPPACGTAGQLFPWESAHQESGDVDTQGGDAREKSVAKAEQR